MHKNPPFLQIQAPRCYLLRKYSEGYNRNPIEGHRFPSLHLPNGYINSPDAVKSFFLNGIPHDKTIWMPMEDVFDTLTEYRLYDATNDYQLNEITSEEVDGNLLGIYNGEVPYTSTVTYPHFTTFNVAEKAVDGKLSVEVATE